MRARSLEYVFILDVVGHIADELVSQAVSELNETCNYCEVLGSYPQAAKAARV